MAKPYGHPPHTSPSSYHALSTNQDGNKFVRLSARHDDLNAGVTRAAQELLTRGARLFVTKTKPCPPPSVRHLTIVHNYHLASPKR